MKKKLNKKWKIFSSNQWLYSYNFVPNENLFQNIIIIGDDAVNDLESSNSKIIDLGDSEGGLLSLNVIGSI